MLVAVLIVVYRIRGPVTPEPRTRCSTDPYSMAPSQLKSTHCLLWTPNATLHANYKAYCYCCARFASLWGWGLVADQTTTLQLTSLLT